MKFKTDTYGLKLDIDARNLLVRYTGENSFKLEFQTASQKTIGLELTTDIEYQSTSTAVRTDIKFRTLDGNQYQFTGGMNWAKLSGPYSFKIHSQYKLRLPDGKNAAFDVEIQHMYSQEQRAVEFKVSTIIISICFHRTFFLSIYFAL